MNGFRPRILATGLVVALAFGGCAGGPSFSELFDASAASEGTGVQGSSLVRAVVILARHPATARQRAVAEENARRAIVKLEREIATENLHADTKPAKPEAAAAHSQKKSARASAKPAKKLPARIAVRTIKESDTAPAADAAVMLYDVKARRIVGNEVYDIEQEPAPGETVRFDTSVARYVGVSAY